MLWFTWFQVALYDVRFSVDSIFDRICKTIQFGVMVGFAITGPQFDPENATKSTQTAHAFKQLSFLLMGSRVVIAAQYILALCYVRKYPKTRLPLIFVILLTTIAAVIYLIIGIQYDRKVGVKTRSYIAWYVVAFAETVVTMSVSIIWRNISFKGTHFIQRMTLLTLIILGEGIIVLCKSIAYIVQNKFPFSAEINGNVAASVLIIYFLYMLYFDRIDLEAHFGTIRQQLWAFWHVALHLALVLFLAGMSQFILWKQGVIAIEKLTTAWSNISQQFSRRSFSQLSDWQDYANALNATAQDLVFQNAQQYSGYSKGFDDNNKALQQLVEIGRQVVLQNGTYHSALFSNATAASEMQTAMLYAEDTWLAAMFSTTLGALGIKVPKTKTKAPGSPSQVIESYDKVFVLVYRYTFVAAGAALIFLGIIAMLGSKNKSKWSWIRLSSYLLVGTGLGLCALISLTDTINKYILSDWILPTFTIALGLVLLVNYFQHKG